ncbi:hypothetical protein [Natrinema sp. CGMCC1.2065]|uniref:hypothetical protein n=1 Tax=Natrinema sp. CGMCC1.2065 TaxID=3445767 RepID=UPI003F4A5F06
MTEEETQSQAGRNWLSVLNEARSNCRRKVADAMVSVPDPNKVLWRVSSRNRMTEAQEAAMEAHVAVIDYHDQLIPYRKEDGVDEELWTETLATVAISEEKALEVTLDDLDAWEFEFFENEIERDDELYGETSDVEQYRVLLPVSGMRACYRQLNQITKDLGFAADADAAGLPKGGLKTPEPGQ